MASGIGKDAEAALDTSSKISNSTSIGIAIAVGISMFISLAFLRYYLAQRKARKAEQRELEGKDDSNAVPPWDKSRLKNDSSESV
ncbi:hypothetical protein GYMLUDRAFT_262543 [Collybiopsis luxurians FD-317 M1]|uniref:Uncharacterized protein n=1 Tax=Collybiopsis luxurians FD-317 M1 TaxID=944289 RepID=A0A0D0CIP4_9AGAR|nr:hypothetical protein GYMLUDRAFT_262543 [Collybiopsis luxurians FD-317 M1]